MNRVVLLKNEIGLQVKLSIIIETKIVVCNKPLFTHYCRVGTFTIL